MQNPGFTRFVTLDEVSHPQLFRRVTNAELPFDTNGLQEKTHVASRLIALPSVTIEDMSEQCALEAFQTLHIETGDIGALVLATCYPGDPKGMAKEIARRLHIDGEIYGVDKACSGFTEATAIAEECARELHKTAVIIATEKTSDMINWERPDGKMWSSDDKRARGKASKIFGDKTATVFVKPPGTSYRFEILDAFATDDKDDQNLLELTSVEDAQDIEGNVRPGITPCINMPGKAGGLLLKHAPGKMVESLRESIQRALDRNRLEARKDPDHIVHHQANGDMVQTIEKELLKQGVTTKCKIWNCISEMGNVSCVSIPAAMAQIQDELKPGEFVAMPAVGAGSPGFRKGWLTRGSVLVRVRAA